MFSSHGGFRLQCIITRRLLDYFDVSLQRTKVNYLSAHIVQLRCTLYHYSLAVLFTSRTQQAHYCVRFSSDFTVDTLNQLLPIVMNDLICSKCLLLVLRLRSFCPFWFCSYLTNDERADCFTVTLIVFLSFMFVF